jgi:Reverse transcriptase (RNA-dependent DNA polymerase).
MSKKDKSRLLWRALLTETLPYEVPLIFSNDGLFLSLLNERWSDDESKLFDALVTRNKSFTRPYSYKINKDRGGKTTLSIAHPDVQLRMSEFYYNYAQTILQYTSKSEFSLRYPLAITPAYSESELAGDKTFKLGLPHVDPEEGELDVSHVVSFFSYRYNLLSKFVSSTDYITLEKKFSRMRTLDVAKCFFNIYTHSITWAVKGKEYAKRNKDHSSFEASFDELMQRANFNETNGIIVGPEISRIFAEVIFQEIDVRVRERISRHDGVKLYDIRRYVDDYFIFANSGEELDLIEEILSEELEKFKLFINYDKKQTTSRPFVSDISLARRDIGESISNLRHLIIDMKAQTLPLEMRRNAREIKRRIGDLRLVVAQYGVGFHTISGWVFSSLRSTFAYVSNLSKGEDITGEQLDALTDVAAAILRLVFYVFSLDVRVRTTYSLCQMMIAVEDFTERNGSENKEYLQQIAYEELYDTLTSFTARLRINDLNNSVEVANIFIILASYFADYFKNSEMFSTFIERTNSDELTYFGFIASKFCLLRCAAPGDKRLELLNSAVEKKLLSVGDSIRGNCEHYMMMIDYLASPDVIPTSKRRVIETCVNFKKATNAAMEKVLPGLSFVDWEGTQIEHLLQRKQLRSVYTWS